MVPNLVQEKANIPPVSHRGIVPFYAFSRDLQTAVITQARPRALTSSLTDDIHLLLGRRLLATPTTPFNVGQHPYLLGWTGQALPPRNWERLTSDGVGDPQWDGPEWRPLGPPGTLFKNTQGLTHWHWGPQHIPSWGTQHHHLPKGGLLQQSSWRIQGLPPKQLALAQHTPFNQCFWQDGPLWGKATPHNDPWPSEVRLPQQVTAKGFQTANANTPQWPHKHPRYGNGTRTCRCPAAPCLFPSANNSRLIRLRTLVSASLIHRT